MSQTVDKKVVEMYFDNRQFETGTAQSLTTIDRLKRALNFESAARGLGQIGDLSRNFNLDAMASAVESLSARFSTMGIIGMATIANLTNAAIAMGSRMASALTIDAAKMGFSEYETQTNAVQTILANTSMQGTTLKDVTAALDVLNTYADKTIYNFSEMTRNIGTFTAAGIDLKTSTAAIKGIANLAAMSGSNANQASMAMYQLSQAMASGTVKLIDWNSVVNAGMGGKVFQNALTDTARAMGTNIDAIIAKAGSFRESLSTGWLTTEVLTNTLQQFTGDLSEEQLRTMGYSEEQIKKIVELGKTANDAATKVKTFTQLWDTLREAAQSGWAKSWQIIIGDFEEAKVFMTEISNAIGSIIGKSSDARNKVLQTWKDLGGRTALIDTLRNVFTGLVKIVEIARDAFASVFPPITGFQLYKLTIGLWMLSRNFKISEESAAKFKRIFTGIASIFAIVGHAIGFVVGWLGNLAQKLLPSGDAVLEFFARMGDFAVQMKYAFTTTEGFQALIGNIATAFKNFGTNVKTAFVNFTTYLSSSTSVQDFLSKLGLSFDSLKTKFKEWGEKVKIYLGPAGDWIAEKFNALVGFLTPIFEKLKSIFNKLALSLSSIFSSKNNSMSGIATTLQNVFGGIAIFLGEVIPKIKTKLESFAPILERVGKSIGDAAGKLGEVIGKAFAGITFQDVLNILNSGVLVAIFLEVRKFINNGGEMFKTLTETLDSVRGSLEAWQQSLKAGALLKIALALGVLALSLIAISMIPSDKLLGSVSALSLLFGELMGAMVIFDKLSGAGSYRAVIAMMGLSVAILILAKAMEVISKLDSKALVKGMMTIGVLAAEISVAYLIFSQAKTTDIIKSAIAVIGFSVAIYILTEALKALGDMKWEQLENGLKTIGLLLLEIGAFLAVAKFENPSLKLGISLMLLAGALYILAVVVERIGLMDPVKMGMGLLAILGILAEVAAFSRALSGEVNLIKVAVGMAILAGSLWLLSGVLMVFASMNQGAVFVGLMDIAAALGIVGLAMQLMPKEDMLKTALSLAIVTATLYALAGVVALFASIPWQSLIIGIAGIGGSLALIAAGLNLMDEKALSGAFALIVVALAFTMLVPAIAALGMLPFDKLMVGILGLALILGIIGGAAALIAPVVPALIGLAEGILLLGLSVLAIGAGIMFFAIGLASLVATLYALTPLLPTLADNLAKAMLAVSEAIQKAAPSMLQTAKLVLLGLATVILEVAPVWIETFMTVLASLLATLAAKAPEMYQSGMDLLMAFLNSLRDNIGQITQAAIDIFNAFVNAISSRLPEMIQTGFTFVISLINGMADGIDQNMPALLEAGNRLFKSVLDGIALALVGGNETLKTSISEMCLGMIQTFGEVLQIGAHSAVFFEKAKLIVAGIIFGIQAKIAALKASLMNMVTGMITEITRRVNDFIEAGRAVMTGFADGIKKYALNAVAAARGLAQQVVDAIKSVLHIASPSGVMVDLMGYMVDGIVLGIDRFANLAYGSADELGTGIANKLSDATSKIAKFITTDFSTAPVVTPVLDLTDIKSGIGVMNGMFGATALNVSGITGRLPVFATQANEQSSATNQNGTGVSVAFTQINNSPEPLSTYEIYRQTRNLVTTVKDVVG